MNKMREEFEAWYNANYVKRIIPADRTEGGYQIADQQEAWDIWQAAAERYQPKWISVDTPPEKYGEYFCKTKARPHGWVFKYAPVGWICSDDYPVTHWMPLPAPKEQDDE